MLTLQNDRVKVKINELGAELKSMVCDEKEYIWQSCKEIWNRSSPLLFPICGGLKDDKYTYNGKEYVMPKHGFGSTVSFVAEYADDKKVVLVHKSNDETKLCYPFDYELRITYELKNTALNVSYRVDNKSKGAMYFSIGAHEGYYTPEGIENYDVVFPQPETLNSYVLYGNLLSDQLLPIIKDSNVLPLYEKYFTVDALVFKELKSKSAILRSRTGTRAVKIDFDFAPYFLIWHKQNAPYICLEPWDGIQDIVGSDYDITKKEGIIMLDRGQTYRAIHTITVLRT